MLLQSLIVALLVAGSFVYAGWTLMPAGLRRSLATLLLRWPGLARWHGVSRRLQAATQTPSGCGACGSCDSTSPQAQAAAAPSQVLKFYPPPPR